MSFEKMGYLFHSMREKPESYSSVFVLLKLSFLYPCTKEDGCKDSVVNDILAKYKTPPTSTASLVLVIKSNYIIPTLLKVSKPKQEKIKE